MNEVSSQLTREDRLRARLVDVASRRLSAEQVEPVVREVLASLDLHDKGPVLKTALRALHACVENHYASKDTPTLASRQDTDAPLVVESLDASELQGACHRALRRLDEDSPAAAGYLRQLASGVTPADIAGRVKISREVLYQRLFRGRGQLDRFLVGLGVRT